MDPIKVLVVDDHYLVRRGVIETLSEAEGIQVVGEASNGAEAVLKAAAVQPDVVIIDLQMPVMGGVEATRELKSGVPQANIMVLTVSEKEADLFAAMGAGAKGYLLKNAGSDELVRAVLHIAEGGVLVSPAMASTMLAQLSGSGGEPPLEGATELRPREREVLQWVAQGATNKEIAASLFISENTVKTHMRNIMEKLHLSKRSQAAAYAVRAGIHRPEGPEAGQQS